MQISQNKTNHIKSEESLNRSYFEAATEAGVQILDVLLSRTGLESPLDELDPVDDPGHLALDVGRLHRQLGGGLEAGLGLSEGRGGQETKPLERIRLATARGASSLLTTNLLVSLTTSLPQSACLAVLVLMAGLQEVVVEISHFVVLQWSEGQTLTHHLSSETRGPS